MPKRTNKFQKLIYLIHQQLAEDAQVTESKMLRDRITGEDNEVDIAIEQELAGTEIVISVECRGRERPATREWVNEMWGKHQHLPTKHLILISESGFTKAAKEKARILGIEALSLSAAIKSDWTEIVNRVKNFIVFKLSFNPTNYHFLFAPQPGLVKPPVVNPSMKVLNELGKSYSTLGSVLNQVSRFIFDKIVLKVKEDKSDSFFIQYDFPKGSYIVDEAGNNREIVALQIKGTYRREGATTVDLDYKSFRNAQIASGIIKGPIGDGLIAVIEQQGKPPAAVITGKLGNNNDEITLSLTHYESPKEQ
jgi:Restriction endonuclease